MDQIIAFSVIALLLVMSPGPNGVLILKTVTSHGTSASISNILGLFSATFIHGALSIFGLSALILQSAEIFTLVKFIGAAYLIYIGIKAIWSSFQTSEPDSNTEKISAPSKSTNYNPNTNNQQVSSTPNFFLEGFITQVFNPKVSMFYLAAFPQFITFDQGNIWSAFLLVTIHALIIFIWFLVVTFTVQRVKKLNGTATIGRWVQRSSGGLLLYFGGLLATQKAIQTP